MLARMLCTLLLLFPLLAVLGSAVPTRHGYEDDDLDAWLARQTEFAVEGLLANISPEGTKRGVVVAATSRDHPNYWYHWTRDSALVMSVVNGLYARSSVGSEASELLETRMLESVTFARHLQYPPRDGGEGLGEPKFNVDGTTFTGPWGRPQNDGPALRALTMIQFAEEYLARGGDEKLLRELLYPAHARWGIKPDLAYVSSPTLGLGLGFDLWEEVKGHHFYTRMVQHAALVAGQRFAATMGDDDSWYWADVERARQHLEAALPNHWSRGNGHIIETLNWAGGVDYKVTNLDAATLLAVLHTRREYGLFSPHSPEIQFTFLRLLDAFEPLYAINSEKFDPVGDPLAPALGRYAEDVYDGYGESTGNPWVLLTAAAAEYIYASITQWLKDGEIEIAPSSARFINRITGNRDDAPVRALTIPQHDPTFHALVSNATRFADSFLNRVRRHAPPDGRLSEQMNRDTGFMQGAIDLTWSYASIVTANWAREEVKQQQTTSSLFRQDSASDNALPAAMQ
ncbi:glycoside hydrolase 15 protein [Geranomyces variabilis]|nr:glycoside hydrolase 15 protein [Geranomyces variabilis]